jgi:hypothetical protein
MIVGDNTIFQNEVQALEAMATGSDSNFYAWGGV